LNSVIHVIFRANWDQPVYVINRQLEEFAIDGPREALRYLHDEVTTQTGHTYCNAVLACHAAMRHPARADSAREAFVAAYDEYKMTKQI
jgi:hypothetical protein